MIRDKITLNHYLARDCQHKDFHSPPEKSRVKPVSFLENSPRYYTYVVTLWEERSPDPAKPPVWRFRLEMPRTGQQRGFATFKEMVVFLEDQMRGGNEAKKQETQHLDF